MLQEDTTFVPFFRRGYSTDMIVLKNRANVVSQLDANRDKLRARLTLNPQLVNAQFVPLSFATWRELTQTVDLFVRAGGDPRAASSQGQASAIAFLAAYFQTGADRDWLRLFVQSLDDESSRFYHSYWLQQQRERSNVLDLVDTLWQRTYRPRMQRFLNNTQQAQGSILLSLPLDGEGRSLTNGKQSNTITVTFPERPSDAVEAIYVIAHEAVGGIASTAVNDNITPEQRREVLHRVFVFAEAFPQVEVLTVDNPSDGVALARWLDQRDPERAARAREMLAWNAGARGGPGVGIGCVDERGDVHPDQFSRHRTLGNIREMPFSEIWQTGRTEWLQQMRSEDRPMAPMCQACPELALCGGGMRARAELATGDPWAADPSCSLAHAA